MTPDYTQREIEFQSRARSVKSTYVYCERSSVRGASRDADRCGYEKLSRRVLYTCVFEKIHK